MVIESFALPALLVQVIPKVVVLVSDPVVKDPLVLLPPAQPFPPLVPVQEVALLEDQRRMVLVLYGILLLSAVRETVGAGGGGGGVLQLDVVKEIIDPVEAPFWFEAIARKAYMLFSLRPLSS